MRNKLLVREVTHEEYYRSVYRETGIDYHGHKALVTRVKACLEDGDIHLNNIPLKYWDGLAASAPRLHIVFKMHGDYFSLAGGVCAVKQAARDAVLDGEELVGVDR